jgi:hypothetical protein
MAGAVWSITPEVATNWKFPGRVTQRIYFQAPALALLVGRVDDSALEPPMLSPRAAKRQLELPLVEPISGGATYRLERPGLAV